MKNVLITGGFGLLGSNLYNFLKNKKYNVFILDKKRNFLKKNYLKIKKDRVFLGDYLDKKLIKKIIIKKKINIIFHTGAVTQVLDALNNPEYTYNNNINGTLNFLNLINNINKKIIFIYSSSDKAYGEVGKRSYREDTCLNSIFPYDVSKSCADLNICIEAIMQNPHHKMNCLCSYHKKQYIQRLPSFEALLRSEAHKLNEGHHGFQVLKDTF